jgi:hypothetical protein
MMVRISAVAFLALLGCDEPALAPDAEALVGRWQAPTETLGPKGSLEWRFVVTAGGHSETRTTSRGVYAGQDADALSAEVVLYGRIRVRDGYFAIQPDSEVTRDLFYGPSYRSVKREFTGWPADSTHFELRGDELLLEFYTYPADAPVLTQRVLSRVP